MIKAGKLDRRITIRQRTKTQDPKRGTYSYAWSDLATVWAEVQEMLPSRAERIAEGINIARRPIRVRTRYRDDITSDMRVQYQGAEYRIVGGPAELGRREGTEMVCELLSTEGDEA